MLPWLFNIFKNSWREEKEKVRYVGVEPKLSLFSWSVVACPFVDDTALLVQSAKELQESIG